MSGLLVAVLIVGWVCSVLVVWALLYAMGEYDDRRAEEAGDAET